MVRHGQSEWNALGRWQGQADPPLTELGRNQARNAVKSLQGFDLVISSDLQRSRQTAEIIRVGLGVDRVHVEAELRERHAGSWTGLTRSEIEHGWPGFLEDGRRPPGYEGDESLRTRALAGIERATETAAGRQAVVISHAGVVYALEAIAGLGFERIPNLAGRWFAIDAGRLTAHDRVTLVDPDEVEVTVPGQL